MFTYDTLIVVCLNLYPGLTISITARLIAVIDYWIYAPLLIVIAILDLNEGAAQHYFSFPYHSKIVTMVKCDDNGNQLKAEY